MLCAGSVCMRAAPRGAERGRGVVERRGVRVVAVRRARVRAPRRGRDAARGRQDKRETQV